MNTKYIQSFKNIYKKLSLSVNKEKIDKAMVMLG